jgi:DNA-binding SARP family transcriptional activator
MQPSAPPYIRLTGAPAAGRDEAGARALERKDAAWLALLALDGPSPRERIAAWLWPEAAPRTAAGSLRQRVFRLRRRLGHDIVRAADIVALLPDVSPLLDGGVLLAGLDYADCPEFAAWLQRQREMQRARRLEAIEHEAARRESAGDLDGALAAAAALVDDEPLSEHGQRRLMRLHYLRGDRAAALGAFERFERLLKDELSTRPGRETLELLSIIERARPLAPPAAPLRSAVPTSLLRPPLLVGRRRELATLQEAWAAARVFIVLGEAGMGKSRLLAELAAARPGALTVAARPGDAGVPFALLARLLRQLRERRGIQADEATRRELARVLPELGAGAALAGEGQRLLLQRAVAWMLAAAAPAELLLDDLHFADDASLEMLRSLLAAEPVAGLHWGLAQRGGEGGAAAGALAEALADTQRLQPVVLKPLAEDELVELVASLGLPELDARALAAPLRRHTGGNPLFVLETLKDMLLQGAGATALPQPAGVGALIERRLRTLGPQALALARVAAIAGVDFDIELAESVLKTPALALADSWAELEAAQVLAGGAFAHDLVFDAVQRGVPAEVARQVHAAVAGFLAERGAEPARIGEHWIAAQRWAEAAPCLERAADAARAAGRMVDALALRRRAADAHRRAGQAQAAWRSELPGVELELFTAGPGPAGELAERLLAQAPDEPGRIAALQSLALVHMMASRWPETRDCAADAIARAAVLGHSELALDAARLHGQAQAQLGRAAEAVRALQELQAAVERVGSLRQRYEQRTALAYALNLCARPADSAAALREAIELAGQAGDLAEVMSSLVNLASCEVTMGRVASALEHARAAHAMRERVGGDDGPHALINAMNMGVMAAQLGRFDEALALLEPAPQQLQGVGAVWQANASNHLAALWLTLGQWHRAEALLKDPADSLAPTLRRRRAVLRARLARWRGDAAAASPAPPSALAALEAELGAAGDAGGRELAAVRLEASRWVERARALALVREVRRDAEAAGMAGLALHALQREVELLLAVDPQRAFEMAARLAAAGPDLAATEGYLPEVMLVLAQACLAQGVRADAERALARAREWIAAAAATLPAGLRRAFVENHPVHGALRSVTVG